MFKFKKYRFSKKDKKLAELRVLRIALAVLLGLILAAWLVVWQTGKDHARIHEMSQEASKVQPQQTVPPDGAKIGGPFTLTNQDGKQTSDAQYRGKYLLVYFGYTYCPDMCPTGLQSMSRALDKLGPAADKVQPIFITIDPERDTPANMKEYISSFHPKIVGLTGTAQQIAAVAKEFQVFYAKGEKVDEHDYIMDHSSLIYLMDPNGKFITTFDEEVDPDSIVKTLRSAWGEKVPSNKP